MGSSPCEMEDSKKSMPSSAGVLGVLREPESEGSPAVVEFGISTETGDCLCAPLARAVFELFLEATADAVDFTFDMMVQSGELDRGCLWPSWCVASIAQTPPNLKFVSISASTTQWTDIVEMGLSRFYDTSVGRRIAQHRSRRAVTGIRPFFAHPPSGLVPV